jgi:hypothetical protein
MREQASFLKDVSDATPLDRHRNAGASVGKDHIVELDSSLVCCEQARDDIDECRLATA